MTVQSSTKPSSPEMETLDAAAVNSDSGITLPMLIAAFAVSVFVMILSLSGYHVFMVQKAPAFAKLNLADIVEIKQSQFTLAMLGKDNAKKADGREDALRQVQATGAEIESALNALSAECQCTLLVTGAVLSSSMPDYTERLKEKLGIKGMDKEVLRKLVSSALLSGDTKNLPAGEPQ